MGRRFDSGTNFVPEQLYHIWRHRILVVICIALGLLVGFVVSQLREAEYTATADVLVRTTRVNPFEAGDVSRQLSMQTEIEIAESEKVAQLAAETMGEGVNADEFERALRVTNPPQTAVLRIAVTNADAERAAELANAFAGAYLADRMSRTVGIATRIDEALGKELETLAARSEALREEIESLEPESARAVGLEAEQSLVQAQILEIKKQQVQVRSVDTTPGDVVRTATPPAIPDGPGRMAWLALGGILGFLLGLLVSWLRSLSGSWVSSERDVVRHLGAPVLAKVPRMRRRDDEAILSNNQRSSKLRQAYRALALKLAFGESEDRPRTILVVEARSSGAATEAAVSVAANLSEIGQSVALVEADLRAPTLVRRLPLTKGSRERADRELEVEAWPTDLRLNVDVPGALILIPGRVMSHVTERLISPKVEAMINALRHTRDFVIIVTPALLSEADGLELAHLVDAVLVICDRKVRIDDLEVVRDAVRGTGGVIVGSVLVQN